MIYYHECCLDNGRTQSEIQCGSENTGIKINPMSIPQNLTWPEYGGYIYAAETAQDYCVLCKKIVTISLGSYSG